MLRHYRPHLSAFHRVPFSSVRPRIPRRALAAVLTLSPPSAEKSTPAPQPRPAPPNPAAVASRSRDADTPRASLASEHRSPSPEFPECETQSTSVKPADFTSQLSVFTGMWCLSR